MELQVVQNKINEKFDYLTVIKYLGKSTYLFNDHEYGEFEGKLSDVLRKQRQHYKRQKSMKNLPLDEIKFRLNKEVPHVVLLEYNGFSEKAKFLDKDYGEFEAIFKFIYKKRTNHPERSKHNKRCNIKSKSFKEKRKTTMLKKYGVENAMHNEKLKNKFKNTNLEKYGVEYTSQSKEVQETRNKNNLEKYGVISTLSLPEVQNKIKETNLNNYGVENPFKSKKIQEKIKKINIKNGKIRIINDQTIKEFIRNKDYSTTTAHKIIREQGLKALEKYNKKYSSIEQLIEAILIKNDIKYNKQVYFKRNNKFYFSDFEIENKKLIIECDGLYWHSEAKKSTFYHKKKKEFYDTLNYSSLFFREDEIINKTNIVESIILAKLCLIKNKIPARKCELKKISSKEASKFFKENHLMGKGSGTCFVLTYNNEIVSAIRVINKNNIIDINRFCNKLNTVVVGGLSKLLKNIIKNNNNYTLITSFVDMRYGDGSSLIKLDFVEKTNYISFKWTDFKKVYSRQTFSSSSGYDKGFIKIWDCGQKKFELKL